MVGLTKIRLKVVVIRSRATGSVLALLGALAVLATGCATGPLRYKTLGRYKYATFEFTEHTPPLAKPFAAVGGIVVDGTVLVVDTVSIPLVSIPIALKTAILVPFSEPGSFRRHPIETTAGAIVFFPIYLPWSYVLSLYSQSYAPKGTPYFEYFYPGLYGDESARFTDNPIRRTPVESPSPRGLRNKHEAKE